MGYLFLSIAIICEVIMFIFIEQGLQNIDPVTYGIYYLLSVCICVTPLYLIYYKPKKLIHKFKTHQKSLLKITTLTTISTLLFFNIISTLGSTSMALISKLIIIFSAFLGIKYLKEKINIPVTLGIIITFAGAIILSFENFQVIIFPILLGIIYCALWSLSSFYIKKDCHNLSTNILIFYRTWGMGIGLLLYAIITNQFEYLNHSQIIQAFIAGLIGVYGAAFFYYKSHKYLSISSLNSLMAISPVLVAIAAYFFFDQIPTHYKIIGGILIIAGSILIVIFNDSKQQKTKSKNQPQ